MRRSRYDLALIDWGVGGLSVFREIRKVCPKLSMIYVSDSGSTPYGKLDRRALRERLRLIIQGLIDDHGISRVVIACNAASTALGDLAPHFALQAVQLLGVIEPGLELIRGSGVRRVAVIGGRRTIMARSFVRPFRGHKTLRVRGRVAQPLSALIEAGQVHGVELDKTLRAILAPLRKSEALLLACTHYLAVAPQVQMLMPDCLLLDPAALTARWVRDKWSVPVALHARPHHRFMTSGDRAAMQRSAHLAFGIKLSSIEKLGTAL